MPNNNPAGEVEAKQAKYLFVLECPLVVESGQTPTPLGLHCNLSKPKIIIR
jgi:hypothetical protein